MQYAVRFLLVSVACTLAANVGSQEANQEIDSVAEIFLSEGIVATLVVESLDGSTVHTYNHGRSLEQFSPASTFKISCVWCYQEIARKVGAEQYEQALAMLDYGNQSVGNEIDAFWLNGDLRISAIEQIEFLRKIYNYEVPFRREHVDILKEIMLTEQTSSYAIYAKSGWAVTMPQVGWYVGFVSKSDEIWLFAMNLQVDRREQVALRKALTIRSLRALGIIQ